MIKSLYLFLSLIYFFNQVNAQQFGSFNDERDAKVYKTVKIGIQTWIAENLNASRFRNGDLIPQAKSNEEYVRAMENGSPIWCYYNFDPNNEKIYGKLYNYYAVKDKRGLAPLGWKIPSKTDFNTLVSVLGGVKNSINKLKSSNGWVKNGINSSGFSAIPAGVLREEKFEGLGYFTELWSTTPTNDGIDAAYALSIYQDQNISVEPNVMWLCFSVRCIKN